MNKINERLQTIIDQLFDGNKAKFAKSIGIAPTSISNYLSDKRQSTPSADMLEKIINIVDNLSADWLLTGEGDMLKNKSTEGNAAYLKSSESRNELYIETKSGTKYFEISENQYKMRVPFVPYNAYARYACDAAENIESTIEDWGELDFIVDKIGHGNYMAFEIKGDSMDDDSKRSFSHGDKVLARELDRTHWKDKIRYNHYPYWIIVLGNTILCKQIIDHNVETGEITCHSLNPSPEYKDFTVNLKSEAYRLFNIIQKLPAPINY